MQLLPNNQLLLPLVKFPLIFDFNGQNQLIAAAFLLVTFISNIYAISQNRKFEALLGTIYCIASIIYICAADLISLIISLEFITIFACLLIFYGTYHSIHTKQYFLTHLLSSGLLLIGASLIITQTGETKLTTVNQLIHSYQLPVILILLGCLINTGIVFFNGWVVNSYPNASTIGFIYLISFTTKTSLLTILKLFNGIEMLKFFGIPMVIYGVIYALFEQNLKRLLCYLTISQLGFMLMVIAKGGDRVTFLVTTFLFIHILYNSLFALYFVVADNILNIKNYSQLRDLSLFQNPALLSTITTATLIATGTLPIASSIIKISIENILNDDISKPIMLFLKIGTYSVLFSIFLKTKFKGDSLIRCGFITNLSLVVLTSATITSCVLLPQILGYILHDYQIVMPTVTMPYIMKQLGIIGISIITALIARKIPHISTSSINLDLFQQLRNLIRYYVKRKETTKQNKKKKYYNLEVKIDKFLNTLTTLHNQQTAISTIFILLMSFMLTML